MQMASSMKHLNQDGVSQVGELTTLAENDIVSIGVEPDTGTSLLDDLLLKWSKSNNMSTILDEGYRLHNFDSYLHYHVQRAA